MFECLYCGRILKNDYPNCPGCGASSFRKIEYKYDFVIENPPKEGYKINLTNFKKQRNNASSFFFIGFCIIIILTIHIIQSLLTASESGNKNDLYFILMNIPIILILATPMFVLAITKIIRANKKIKKIKKLEKTGKLIKNLKYEIESSTTFFKNTPFYIIKTNYITKNGLKVPIESERKYGEPPEKKDKTVDLLIDPNDNSNYYIDFEIY